MSESWTPLDHAPPFERFVPLTSLLTHVECYWPFGARMTQVEGCELAPSHLDGPHLAQLAARLRCAECSGQLHSVKPWRL